VDKLKKKHFFSDRRIYFTPRLNDITSEKWVTLLPKIKRVIETNSICYRPGATPEGFYQLQDQASQN